ncbi:hypothetical protein BO71DRAFT_74492 [Aspergillus ellipticus CBS 707.79]|uniref:Uncharacterized protein n=1 Tax=Aspergillus ellipticus CBS 707.79 TaxID=1448320 RepID=A0A319DQY2_9EURO|nr:hypothetical protein BO71DRAFT_74492 [Aspergillus ellipticus CBS 707.79]
MGPGGGGGGLVAERGEEEEGGGARRRGGRGRWRKEQLMAQPEGGMDGWMGFGQKGELAVTGQESSAAEAKQQEQHHHHYHHHHPSLSSQQPGSLAGRWSLVAAGCWLLAGCWLAGWLESPVPLLIIPHLIPLPSP